MNTQHPHHYQKLQAIQAALATTHDIKAAIEYPGLLAFTAQGFEFTLGTANGPWGIDVHDDRGSVMGADLVSTDADAADVAMAVASFVKAFLRGQQWNRSRVLPTSVDADAVPFPKPSNS